MFVLTATASAAFAVGCTATVETAQPTVAADVAAEDAVTVEGAPPDVYSYPHTEYNGRTVYWVNGRWYYPRGSHWYYYRHEPGDLVRRRPYVQQAPPAYQSTPVYQAPPAGPAYRPVPEATPVR